MRYPNEQTLKGKVILILAAHATMAPLRYKRLPITECGCCDQLCGLCRKRGCHGEAHGQGCWCIGNQKRLSGPSFEV